MNKYGIKGVVELVINKHVYIRTKTYKDCYPLQDPVQIGEIVYIIGDKYIKEESIEDVLKDVELAPLA